VRHVSPTLEFEQPLWQAGFLHVAGVDEAGRGAWAGPVSAGAVVLPPDPWIVDRLAGVRDSKQMTPLQRAYWADAIRQVALAWGIGFASHDEVDVLGLLPATRLAMGRALRQLPFSPEHLLVDAMKLPLTIPQTPLIKGDSRSLSIAAASVLAKTARDAFMTDMDQRYPGYEFCLHKGYGTAVHQAALLRQGVCAIHRQRFTPVRNLIEYGCFWLEGQEQEELPGLSDGYNPP
jgi:ribonuclease HII